MRIYLLILLFLGLTISESAAQTGPEDSDSAKVYYSQNGRQTFYRINANETFMYEKPLPYQFLLNAPLDIYDYTKESIRLSNWKNLLGMTVLTTMMVLVDQDITDIAKQQGRDIGNRGDNKMKTVAKVFDFPIQMPTDLSSSLYFIGDGWTHISITTSFFAFGLIKSDARALQTSSQLAEGLITVTFFSQLLKHLSGRESPFVSTRSGGRWDPFPNQIEYHKHVPAYDAFPSGHICSAMMMVTVISENYKEYKFIKPLGYTLMTILAYQMLNNGVHWASDYPLGIAMGYSIGKLVLSRGRTVISKSQSQGYHLDSFSVDAGMINGHAVGLTAKLYFN